MPRLLKRETIGCLSAAKRALSLAMTGMALPSPRSRQASSSDYAAEIGLVGAAAELAINACIIEIKGTAGLRKNDEQFHSARASLDNFRAMLKSRVPALSTFFESMKDPSKQLSELEERAQCFALLYTRRAMGLHAGEGVGRDVAYAGAVMVDAFFSQLELSNRWKPYLEDRSNVAAPLRDRQLLAEELPQLVQSGSGAEAGRALQSIFLVLPHLGEDTPEWLNAFDRVSVSPKKGDVTLLMKSLQAASAGEMVQLKRGAKRIAVRIEQDNPSAMPVSIGSIKKTLTSISEQWNAEVGTANARLEKGNLSVPNLEAVYVYYAVGPEAFLSDDELSAGLPAHEVWPFIAASLSCAGTPGPVFRFIRLLQEGEIGQLRGLLSKARKLNGPLDRALAQYMPLFESPKAGLSVVRAELSAELSIRRTASKDMPRKLVAKAPGFVSYAGSSDVDQLGEPSAINTLLERLASGDLSLPQEMVPSVRLLLDAAHHPEVVGGLVRLYSCKIQSSLSLKTSIRKALRIIDFASHGPGD